MREMYEWSLKQIISKNANPFCIETFTGASRAVVSGNTGVVIEPLKEQQIRDIYRVVQYLREAGLKLEYCTTTWEDASMLTEKAHLVTHGMLMTSFSHADGTITDESALVVSQFERNIFLGLPVYLNHTQDGFLRALSIAFGLPVPVGNPTSPMLHDMTRPYGSVLKEYASQTGCRPPQSYDACEYKSVWLDRTACPQYGRLTDDEQRALYMAWRDTEEGVPFSVSRFFNNSGVPYDIFKQCVFQLMVDSISAVRDYICGHKDFHHSHGWAVSLAQDAFIFLLTLMFYGYMFAFLGIFLKVISCIDKKLLPERMKKAVDYMPQGSASAMFTVLGILSNL